jgi:hypothetical protein
MHGLAWGDSEIDGTTKWNATPVIGGLSINTSTGTVSLSDVVGERRVTLKAETTINGTQHTETIVVSFGQGPLSVFTKPPSSKRMQWATARGIPATAGENNTGDFTDLINPSGFPAADFCGGTVHSKSSYITVDGSDSSSYTADFTKGKQINYWIDGYRRVNRYYSTTSKLPTLGQLVAVSAYDGRIHSDVKRKGAAIAAGWPNDTDNEGYYPYWSGQVLFYSDGYFSADFVYLADGNDYGSNFVTYAFPVAACVP